MKLEQGLESMKTMIRIFTTLFTIFASYYFISFIPFSLIPLRANFGIIIIVLSLLISIYLGYFVWKYMGTGSNSLSRYIFLGGIIFGSVGFIIGFVGPIILSSPENQGPLLGIFLTGPVGFIIGLIGGGVFWKLKIKAKKV
ncbi:MAG: hypothetical protein FJY21_03760 [Bacteroidetes bacterium]|nr:hypothetical protein [Bacteroidota bacterium]